MKKMMMLLQMMMLSLLVFALVACGGEKSDNGDADDAGKTEEVSVVMHDMYFGASNDNAPNPPTWTVTHGSTLKVSADNQGTLEHNWAIIKLGEESKVPNPLSDPAQVADITFQDLGNVAGGDKSSKRFVAPEAGEYLVICTVAGHYPMMQGKLIVK